MEKRNLRDNPPCGPIVYKDGEELEEEEFEMLLTQYAKVRDKNWQGSLCSKGSPIKGDEEEIKKDVNTLVRDVTESSKLDIVNEENTSCDFWEELRKLYSAESENPEMLVIEFKKSHDRFVNNLNLDQLERLCIRLSADS